jgi:hypothetical protein
MEVIAAGWGLNLVTSGKPSVAAVVSVSRAPLVVREVYQDERMELKCTNRG